MKKLLSIIVFGTVLVTIASADLVQMKMGAGAWMSSPSINPSYTEEERTYTSNETAYIQGYAWMSVKHRVHIVPNIRIEYTATEQQGKVQGDFSSIKTSDFVHYKISKFAHFNTTSDLANIKSIITHYDFIPYYTVLDNNAWMIDAGLGIRLLKHTYTVSATKNFPGYSEEKLLDTPFPFLYVRSRAQTVIKNIVVETDAKLAIPPLGFDIRAKVDYILASIPNKPTIEVGYRVQGAFSHVINASGVYAGLNLRF